MPEQTAALSKGLHQDPAHAQHRRLPSEIVLLEKHISHFKSVGDAVRVAEYTALLKHTQDGLAHAEKAATLVDGLGLSHEVKPRQITYNDALRFVAKTLHETQHGTTTSNYHRAHSRHVSTDANGELIAATTKRHKVEGGKFALDAAGAHVMEDVAHVDLEKHAAPRDPAAEVIEHLGLTDPAHVAAVNTFFGKAQ